MIIIIIYLFTFSPSNFPNPGCMANSSADPDVGNEIASSSERNIFDGKWQCICSFILFDDIDGPSIHPFASSTLFYSRRFISQYPPIRQSHMISAWLVRRVCMCDGIYVVQWTNWRAEEAQSLIGIGDHSVGSRMHAGAGKRPSIADRESWIVTMKAQTANKFIIFSWVKAECQSDCVTNNHSAAQRRDFNIFLTVSAECSPFATEYEFSNRKHMYRAAVCGRRRPLTQAQRRVQCALCSTDGVIQFIGQLSNKGETTQQNQHKMQKDHKINLKWKREMK